MQDTVHDIFSTVSLKGDEYYTLPEHVNDIADNLNLPYGSHIWCPFDTERSYFVKILRERGYQVTATHISTGDDFFKTDPPGGVYAIVSNPPFSVKRDIMNRVKDMGMRFAILLPIIWLNDGVPFDYGNQIMFWRKRVFFDTGNGERNKARFTCFVLSNGILKQDLTIINK